MMVREYTDDDLQHIKLMFNKSNFDFAFPNPQDFFSKVVIDSPDGIGMSVWLKHTAECYMFCDKDWRNPAWRLKAIRDIQVEQRKVAAKKHIKEVFAFVPPQIECSFGQRLVRTEEEGGLGWNKVRTDWPVYFKVV